MILMIFCFKMDFALVKQSQKSHKMGLDLRDFLEG